MGTLSRRPIAPAAPDRLARRALLVGAQPTVVVGVEPAQLHQAALVAEAHREPLRGPPLGAGETAVTVTVEALHELRLQLPLLTLHLPALAHLPTLSLHPRSRRLLVRIERRGLDRAGRRRLWSGARLVGERCRGATGDEETDEQGDSLHALSTRGRRGG